MAIKGFDPQFANFPDYILKITAQIWEKRQVDLIDRYYADDVLLRSPAGLLRSSAAVIDETRAALKQIPDRQLLGEAVVWCGDDESGYLSSHRILSLGTYAGNGSYGPATNIALRYRVVADCWVNSNQVCEEWLVRDQGAIAACANMSARELAQLQIDAGSDAFFTAADEVPSAYKPKLDTGADAQAYLHLAEALWQDQDLAQVQSLYHPAAVLAAPGGRYCFGHDKISDQLRDYQDALEGAQLSVDDLTAIDEPQGSTVAMRWTLSGSATGQGAFAGARAGAPVYVMGISQARFASGKIAQEWMLIDEVAIWKQLLAA